MNRQRLLQRFLRYVKIDTTARPDSRSYPSSPGQLRLGRLLVRELKAMGIEDARQDAFGIVLATIPATVETERDCEAASGKSLSPPTIALCAHLDTSPETTGKGVKPQVIKKYPGGDIVLSAACGFATVAKPPAAGTGDPAAPLVIRTAENPELEHLVGRTLITTDGTTLLGADDKAGVAVIMETAAWLMEHRAGKGDSPHLCAAPGGPFRQMGTVLFSPRHGLVRICFTCDEEVGHGVDHLNLPELAATVCYTLDGEGSNLIDVETFSADLAVVTIQGVNIHPSIAKGRMTNAVRAAADFLARLPRDHLAPEVTEGRAGFLHPYEIGGGVGEVKLQILLRDFDAARLADEAELLRGAAAATMTEFPQAKIAVEIKTQYRNMAGGLAREPRAVACAQRALERLGRTPKLTIVRGGTDGSRLTELGLPTPNLSCGAHTPHSNLEWACLDEMVESVEWLVSLAEVWVEA